MLYWARQYWAYSPPRGWEKDYCRPNVKSTIKMHLRDAGTKISFRWCLITRSAARDNWSFARSLRTRTIIQKSRERETLGFTKNFFRRNHSRQRVHSKSQGLMSGSFPAHLEKTIWASKATDHGPWIAHRELVNYNQTGRRGRFRWSKRYPRNSNWGPETRLIKDWIKFRLRGDKAANL